MYSITIESLTQKQLLKVIDNLPDKVSIRVANTSAVDAPAATKPKRMNGTTPLMMTGKQAQAGSMREDAMTIFEKLEKRKSVGIGGVTRKMFRDALADNDIDPSLCYQLCHDSFLKANV